MSQTKRTRTKACELCQSFSDTLYRIRYEGSPWVLACPSCQQTVSQRSRYTYGGTWKRKKRH